MNKFSPQRGQLVAVAKMYYEDNLTQNEIASRLGVSRPQVSKLLALAREQGVVTIVINDHSAEEDNVEVLHNLCQKYKLQGGLVLTDHKDLRVLLKQATMYVALELQTEYNVGLGWGAPLGLFVEQFAASCFHTSAGTVYPLIGEAPIPNEDYKVNAMALAVAKALGRKNFLLEEKAFSESREDKNLLEGKNSYQGITAKWRELDLALLAIQNYPSSPDEATGMRFGNVLTRQHAVGSFLSYFYNAQGDILSGENDFTCRASLADLRHCSKVLGLGLGVQVNSLRGALHTGIFTHVILSLSQAKSLLL